MHRKAIKIEDQLENVIMIPTLNFVNLAYELN